MLRYATVKLLLLLLILLFFDALPCSSNCNSFKVKFWSNVYCLAKYYHSFLIKIVSRRKSFSLWSGEMCILQFEKKKPYLQGYEAHERLEYIFLLEISYPITKYQSAVFLSFELVSKSFSLFFFIFFYFFFGSNFLSFFIGK